MANVYTVAKAIERYAETYGATTVRCEWVPRGALWPVRGYYLLTMTVTSGEVWKTWLLPSTGRVICQKYTNSSPIPYERLECTRLYEMRAAQQSPRGYMLHLICTYAKGYRHVQSQDQEA